MMKKKKRFLNNDNNLLTLLMQMAKIMFTGIIAKSTLHLYRNKIDFVVVSEHYLLRTCRSFSLVLFIGTLLWWLICTMVTCLHSELVTVSSRRPVILSMKKLVRL